MYATGCDGCQSRGCWNFLPIASKFVRKIGREGVESHTWQRRGRDKSDKDKTDTLFMRRNNQRHRFARRRRAALQPASRRVSDPDSAALLAVVTDRFFLLPDPHRHAAAAACLPASERERERERERASQSLHSYVAHRNLQTNAKFCCKVPNRNCKNVVRTSFDLQQTFLPREMHRDTDRESARESNRPCASFDVQQNFLQRERETEY